MIYLELTYDHILVDEKHETKYHERLLEFIKMVQHENLVIGGAMTDMKGDRSLTPSDQEDPDLFVHIVKRDEKSKKYKLFIQKK